MKAPLLNDGVDNLLVGHQSPALGEVVLRVLLGGATHTTNICSYLWFATFSVKIFDDNMWWDYKCLMTPCEGELM